MKAVITPLLAVLSLAVVLGGCGTDSEPKARAKASRLSAADDAVPVVAESGLASGPIKEEPDAEDHKGPRLAKTEIIGRSRKAQAEGAGESPAQVVTPMGRTEQVSAQAAATQAPASGQAALEGTQAPAQTTAQTQMVAPNPEQAQAAAQAAAQVPVPAQAAVEASAQAPAQAPAQVPAPAQVAVEASGQAPAQAPAQVPAPAQAAVEASGQAPAQAPAQVPAPAQAVVEASGQAPAQAPAQVPAQAQAQAPAQAPAQVPAPAQASVEAPAPAQAPVQAPAQAQAPSHADSPVVPGDPMSFSRGKEAKWGLDAEQVERRAKFVETLIETSSGAKRIQESGNQEAIAMQQKARGLKDQALALNAKGDFEGASKLLSDASQIMFQAARGADGGVAVEEKHKQDFARRLESVKELLIAHDRISKEKGQDAQGAESGKQIRDQVDKANVLAAKGGFLQGRVELDKAYIVVKLAIEKMRRGDKLVRSLNFATKKDEYEYEIDRNQTHQMLVKMLLEGQSDAIKSQAGDAVNASSEIRKRAEEVAKQGDYDEAVEIMESSTKELIKAIRAAGVYIPG